MVHKTVSNICFLLTATRICGLFVLRAGRIPTTIGKLTALRILYLRHNKLTGRRSRAEQRYESPH